MSDEHLEIFIQDSNGIMIDLGEVFNMDDFFITAKSTGKATAFARKCEYITVQKGAVDELDERSGKMKTIAHLDTASFTVNVRRFLDEITQFWSLARVGKEWQSDHKAASAAWVKQRIQAALLPFGISQKEMTAIYQQLLLFCSKSDAAVEPLSIVTASDLNSKVYAKPPFIVSGFLCAGLTLLAAPAKTGKSFLALDLACSIAEGTPFWGFKTSKGAVLYCDLEGKEWRTQDRFPAIGRASRTDCPKDLYHIYKAAPVDAGLIDQLTGWIESVENPRLIIIDTLQHVKGRVARGEDAYAADTRFMKPLHDLAVSKGIAILAITHTRKANGFILDDPFDAVIGSTAQYGNSDAGWLIGGKRNDDRKQFTAVGRDFEPVSFEIERSKTGRWIFKGTTESAQEQARLADYQEDKIVQFIKAYLPEHGGRWTCTAQEFINISSAAAGEYLDGITNPIKLSIKLKDLAPQLMKNDDIGIMLPDGSGRKGRLFTFYQKGLTD